MMEKQRLLWIDKDPQLYQNNYMGMFDLTKGIMMVEIILLHCLNDYLNVLLYDGGDNLLIKLFISPLAVQRYGSVPMMFMICGYGIRKQSIGKNIKNNLKLFIVPYLFVILALTLFVLAKYILQGGSFWGYFRYQVVPFFLALHPGRQYLGNYMEQIGPIWFFFTYIFGAIFLNIVLQEKQKWVQVLVLITGAIVAVMTVGIPLPYCIQQILICAGFMYVGMHLKTAKVPLKKLPVYLVILVYLLCVIATTAGGLAEIGNNTYFLGGLDLAIAYVAGIVMLCLHQRLNVVQGILADGLRWIGRHMMWFCCLHTITYLLVPWERMGRFFHKAPAMGALLEFLISFIYAVAGCKLIEIATRTLLELKKRKGKEGRKL